MTKHELELEVEKLKTEKDNLIKICEEIQALTVKEFVFRFKEKCEYYENEKGLVDYLIYADDFDNIAKEIVGVKNER